MEPLGGRKHFRLIGRRTSGLGSGATAALLLDFPDQKDEVVGPGRRLGVKSGAEVRSRGWTDFDEGRVVATLKKLGSVDLPALNLNSLFARDFIISCCYRG